MDQNIILGGAYKLIKDVPSGSVDFALTDPPYLFDGINFVGWEGSSKSDIDTTTLKERRGQLLHASRVRARIEEAWALRRVVQ